MSQADSFDDNWLALRESADIRARDAAGADAELQAAFASRDPGRKRILDLGAGTGANFRRLAPLLGTGQRWTLVDHDARLLERLEARLAPWVERHGASLIVETDTLVVRADGFDAVVRRLRLDLASAIDTLPFATTDLVTGSALLDLAGHDWLDTLARLCADGACAVLLALSYDGRLDWTPRHADDEAVHERFDRHQRTDKGLGPSLGPDAVGHFANRLVERGLAVSTPRSDWTLDAGGGELQRELAQGFARAAADIDPAFTERAGRWLDARLALIDAGTSSLVVGHEEVLLVRRRDGGR